MRFWRMMGLTTGSTIDTEYDIVWPVQCQRPPEPVYDRNMALQELPRDLSDQSSIFQKLENIKTLQFWHLAPALATIWNM